MIIIGALGGGKGRVSRGYLVRSASVLAISKTGAINTPAHMKAAWITALRKMRMRAPTVMTGAEVVALRRMWPIRAAGVVTGAEIVGLRKAPRMMGKYRVHAAAVLVVSKAA